MNAAQKIQRVLTLMRDPRVGKLPRFALLAAVAYLISPVDLVPDFVVPIVGWLDDATLIWMALRWLIKAGDDADRAGQLDVPTAKRID
jgi:uncharacterized membrane protein YkvA (DUF1232 family)